MQTVAPVRERDPGAHGCGTGGEEGGEEESGFFLKKKISWWAFVTYRLIEINLRHINLLLSLSTPSYMI
jgi:hypothetical protein